MSMKEEYQANPNVSHHYLGRVNRLVRAFVRRNFECLRHGFNSRQDMRDGLLHADAARGDKADVTVNMTVNRKSISLRRLFVTVRCKEIVDFPYTVPEEKDSKGKVVTPAKSLRVTKEETLFEREFTIVAGQDLAANSHHTFKGGIEIPANLPPSMKGKNAQVRWEAFAGTDIPGIGDPASSWQEIAVK